MTDLELELELEKLITHRSNPLFWLEDRLGEDPRSFQWSLFQEDYKDHKWDGDKDPLSSAWESVANQNWTAVEASTGSSKTYMLARMVLWWLDVYKGGTCVFIANTEKQLKMNLWKEIGKLYPKFRRIHPQSELLTLNLRMDNTKNKEADSFGWEAIGLIAGVGAGEESATSIQGIHNENLLIIVEEGAGTNPAIMQALKQTAVADNNIIISVGNPDHEHDELHKFAQLDRVHNYRVSSLDFPNVVLDRTVFAGAVTKNSIEHRANELGVESDLYKSRVRGISPAQAKDSLIRVEWFDQCVGHIPDTSTWNAVGVDVARSLAGDKAAVAFGESSVLKYLRDFACPNASHLAFNLIYDTHKLLELGYLDYSIPTTQQYNISGNFIGVDAVGVGVSTVETFANEGMNVTSLQGGQWVEAIALDEEENPYYRFVSLRAQMYWEAREDLRKMLVGIDIKDTTIISKLRKELLSPKLVPNTSGIKVEEKEAIKKRLGYSPNLADAFVYWNWVRKGYRIPQQMDYINFYGGSTD